MQLKMGRCALRELLSSDDVTWYYTLPVTSAQVQPSTDFICLCLLIDSQSVMLVLRYIMTASTSGKLSSQLYDMQKAGALMSGSLTSSNIH